jgi:recombination associated protein RdgC
MSFFKNIVVYRIGNAAALPSVQDIEDALQRNPFVPCEPTQDLSAGFVSPRGEEHAPLVENVGGQLIIKLAVERKSVPGGAVKAELERRCKEVEAQTGRKPGRKEKANMKEEIVRDLMPRAFSKHSANTAWIDRENGFLVIGAGSHRGADGVVANIVDAMTSAGQAIQLTPLNTVQSPSGAMAAWLTKQIAPESFSLDRDVELKSTDEDKAVVRYARHSLALDEIVNHIAEGKMPTRLSLTWDDRLAFILTSEMTVKKIDVLKAKTDSGDDSGFDADVAIATGELKEFLPALLNALGGEMPTEAADVAHQDSAERV